MQFFLSKNRGKLGQTFVLVRLYALTTQCVCSILEGKGGEIMISGANSAKLQLTVTPAVLLRVNRLAQEAGMTKSHYLTMLINEKWKEGNHTDGEVGLSDA